MIVQREMGSPFRWRVGGINLGRGRRSQVDLQPIFHAVGVHLPDRFDRLDRGGHERGVGNVGVERHPEPLAHRRVLDDFDERRRDRVRLAVLDLSVQLGDALGVARPGALAELVLPQLERQSLPLHHGVVQRYLAFESRPVARDHLLPEAVVLDVRVDLPLPRFEIVVAVEQLLVGGATSLGREPVDLVEQLLGRRQIRLLAVEHVVGPGPVVPAGPGWGRRRRLGGRELGDDLIAVVDRRRGHRAEPLRQIGSVRLEVCPESALIPLEPLDEGVVGGFDLVAPGDVGWGGGGVGRRRLRRAERGRQTDGHSGREHEPSQHRR